MLFSRRNNLRPKRKAKKLSDQFDTRVRKRIWTVLEKTLLCVEPASYSHLIHSSENDVVNRILIINDELIAETGAHFGRDVDEAAIALGKWFQAADWYELIDCLEIVQKIWLDHSQASYAPSSPETLANRVFELEDIPLRMTLGRVTSITTECEINEIESAFLNCPPTARIHLDEALRLLSDHQSTDFRNVAKEAISAAEAVARHASNDPNATMGKAISLIAKKHSMPAALEKSMSALYGYASNDDGIRHATKGQPRVTRELARYILVHSVAICNYLASLR